MAEPAHQLDDGSIYDESDGSAPSDPRSKLRALEGGGESSGPSRSQVKPANIDSDSLAEQESSGSNVTHENQVGRGYRHTGPKQPFLSKVTATRKRKYLAIGGGVGAIFISLAIALLGSFYATLKLPHLQSHLDRRLARSARTFTERVNALQTDKTLADASTDTEVKSLLSKSPLGKALNIYKPELAVKAMQANGSLNFEYDSSGRISAVNIGDQRVEAPELDFKHIFKNRTAWKQFYKDLYTATDTALLHDGQSYEVRTRVSKAVIQAFGGKLYFWQRKGATEEGKSAQKVEQDTQLQLFDDIQTSPTEGPAITQGADSTAQQALEDERNCLAKPSCAQEVSTGQLSLLDASGASKRIADYASSLSNLANNPYIGALTILYTVAVPTCMIYDGSMKTAKAVVDAQQSAALKAFLALNSAADQQKPGDTTASAVQGLNSLIGDISDTNPEKLANGEAINTTADPYAQTTRTQDYTIFGNVFGALTGTAQAFSEKFCGEVLNPDVLYTTLGISAAAQLLPGLGALIEKALEQFSTEGLKIAAQQTFKDILKNAISRFTDPVKRKVLKNSALKFGLSNGAYIAGTDTVTYLARMIVLAEMGAFVNGADPKDLVNQADMGGVVYNSEIDRQGNFGRPMTAQETNQTKLADTDYWANQSSQKSVYQRYFALSNPNSFMANSVVSSYAYISHPSKVVASIINFPSTLFSSVKPLFSIFAAHAAAASSTDNEDYNVIQWGWTNDEDNLINSDPSYDPLVNAQILADATYGNEPASKAILDQYGTCFGVKDDGSSNAVPDPSATMGSLISSGDGGSKDYINLDGNGSVVANSGICSPDNLSYNSPDPMAHDGDPQTKQANDLIFRWRLNQSYLNAMGELSDMQTLAGATP